MSPFRLISALFLSCVLAGSALADGTGPGYADALDAFDNGEFERSVAILEEFRTITPECSECAHLLGRSYGRLAEQSNWTKAIGLAKKTRVAFEDAMSIDPTNTHALEDLIRYYRSAPGFLGGDKAKAETLEKQLQAIRTSTTG
jgi:hypothetical protein